MTIGFIAHLGNAFNLLFVREFGDALVQLGFVNLKRNFRNNDRVTLLRAAADPINRGLRAHLQNPATGAIRVFYLFATADKSAGGKVRALYDLKQLFDIDFRIANYGDGRVHDFGQIVWRNFRGHPDRDPIRPVDQDWG